MAEMTISNRVRETIERYGMFSPGDGVVVAVSGGADSMALLHLLEELRGDLELTLHVAHLNHRLRPDAEEDAEFVRTAAGRLGIPATIASADVRGLAAREKRSIEEAGRVARYEFLARVASEAGSRCIAVAHTWDDQVETVLMRLQGDGPWEALAGIPPVRRQNGAEVVRPLREVTRAEVVRYLAQRDVLWREDPTNRDLRVARNRVRHQTLPELVRRGPDVPQVLWKLGETTRDADALLNRLAGTYYGHLASREQGVIRFAADNFQMVPAPLQRRLLRTAILEIAGTAEAPSFVILGDAVRLTAKGRAGREVRAGGALVRVGYGVVEVVPVRAAPTFREYRLEVPGEVAAEGFGMVFSADLAERRQLSRASEKDEAWFDADDLRLPLSVRTWRPGDRFVPSGLTGKKKLQDFFVDAKVPRWNRAAVPLVVDAQDRILWVVGYRAAETSRVTERTNRVLRLRTRRA